MIHTLIYPPLREYFDPINSPTKAPIEPIPDSLDTQPKWEVFEPVETFIFRERNGARLRRPTLNSLSRRCGAFGTKLIRLLERGSVEEGMYHLLLIVRSLHQSWYASGREGLGIQKSGRKYCRERSVFV
jgi:hypothetical protein